MACKETVKNLKFGVIGAGALGGAIARGILGKRLIPAADMLVFDTKPAIIERRQKEGLSIAKDNLTLVKESDVITVAVKAYELEPLFEEIGPHLTPEKIIVSIAAGIPTKQLEKYLPEGTRVIRAMPNTPCVIGEAAMCFSRGTHATEEDSAVVKSFFGALGTADEIQERVMDAVTGLSGSGPAYVYMFIEALADGGVRAGLPRDVAHRLAVQTVKGAATLVQESGLHPGELKDQVTSPGGTTIAGIHALEQGGFRGTVMNAVHQAARRSKEIANE